MKLTTCKIYIIAYYAIVASLLLSPFICQGNYELYILVMLIIGGQNDREGRVEVFHDGLWGTVCGTGWSTDDATVACRELGLPSSNARVNKFWQFASGGTQTWLSEVSCDGSESHLSECGHAGWGIHNHDSWGHSEDAGIVCEGIVSIIIVCKC